MRAISIFILALTLNFATTAIAGADASEFAPTPSPSRIVLNPTAQPMTSQAITWRTDAATTEGAVQITRADGSDPIVVTAESGQPVSFAGWEYQSRHHSAVATGLSPDTTYRYRVGSDAAWSEWRMFRTANDGSDPWSFLYFGDAQNDIGNTWRPVIQKALTAVPDARFMLQTGDLINNSDQDEQWGQWFDGLDGHIDRIETAPATGNHELSGDPFGIQFAEHFTTPGNGPLLARDTVYYSDFQGVRFIALDGNGKDVLGQVSFLREALQNNPNRWSVVYFHQPIFSGSEGRDNPVNRFFLLPILEEFNVDLVLQGHDHVYARGHLTANETDVPGVQTGPVYTVAVAGPKYYDLAPADKNNWTQNDATRVKGFNQTSTYQEIRVDGDVMRYRSVIAAKGEGSDAPGQVGELLDSFTISKLKDGSKQVTEGLKPSDPVDPPKVDPPAEPGGGTPGSKPGRMTIESIATVRAGIRTKLRLSGAGRLTVSGRLDGRRAGAIAKVSRKVRKAGRVALTLKPKAWARKAIGRRGKARVKLSFRFVPETGRKQTVVRRATLRSAR